MTVVGIARVKNEDDIIEATASNMLSQVDHVIVEDNGSTDGTLDILNHLDIEVLHDETVGYYQSAAMSRLAAYAASAHGATWVVPWDADEVWYSPFGRLADAITDHPGAVAAAVLYDHRCTSQDPADGSPIDRMGWRTRDPLPLFKVACRPLLPVTIDQGNHGCRYPTQDPLHGQIVIRHFPLRSPEHMVRKARTGAAAYAATDLPEDAGGHWRGWGRILEEQGEEALHDVFREHYWYATPEEERSLIFDPSPASSRGVPAGPTAAVPGATSTGGT